ncbi:hypothetical protein SPSIL_011870 [Sporomusa silvacetica DSM 10669]|uniref:TPR repeat-containing protein YrrB n=1 Tax=Sporomusa silvacetica DSM 10669 TaxID=1123289 RepID=A0ABZ3II27_9FIRM|nr:tetratricopeptide repeat protein [Sporomusa silvacetica]OZC22073.1 lipoprotein NlpI [Sporomusa silvacetica DSM 10669]
MKRLLVCLLSMFIFCNIAVAFAANQDSQDLTITKMTKIIAEDPRDAVAYLRRGEAYLFNQQKDLAINDFNKAVELNPKYASAYLDRGWIYLKQEQYALAITDFDAAIKLDPKYAKPYFNKGQAYEEQRLYQKAIDTYRSFIANAAPQDIQFVENARNSIRILGGTI